MIGHMDRTTDGQNNSNFKCPAASVVQNCDKDMRLCLSHLHTEWIRPDWIFIDAKAVHPFHFGSCHDWLKRKYECATLTKSKKQTVHAD